MDNINGPHLILAGPGTGKTTFLVNKTVELFKSISSKKDGIIICTFTKKATEELISRIYSSLSIKDINKVNFIIGTIHSICYDLLSRYSKKDYSDYQILPDESQVHFIHSKLLNLGYSNDRIKKNGWTLAQELTAIFNKLNEEQIDVDKIDFKDDEELEEACHVYSTYKKLLTRNRLFDFASIQSTFLKELNESKEFHDKIKEEFKYFFVDEFQDINKIQNDIFFKLTEPNFNLTVVGDDDQSIYAFRGSNVEHIRSFKESMIERKKVIKEDILNVNYRSTNNIVEFSNLILEQSKYKNVKKNIKPYRADKNHPVVINYFETELEEANFIIESIKNLKSKRIIKSYDEIAILFRSIKSHSGLVVELLKQENIPFQLIGAGNFFETIMGREFMALWDFYLAKDIDKKTIFYDTIAQIDIELASDLTSLYSTSSFLEKIDQIFEDKTYFSCIDVAYDLMIETNYFKRYFNEGINIGKITDVVLNFDSFADKFDPWGLYSYLTFLKKNQEIDFNESSQTDSIKIITIHQSKGLEFPVVFLPSQIIRSKRKNIIDRLTEILKVTNHDDDEETRVLYVGCTRAEDLLVISGSKTLERTKRNYELNESIPTLPDSPIISNQIDFNLLINQKFRNNKKRASESTILSYNKINLYNVCPRAYMYSHVWNLQTVRIGGLEFGRNLHKIIEIIIRELIDGKRLEDIDINEIIDINWQNKNFRTEDENQKFKKSATSQIKTFVNNQIDLLEKNKIFAVEDQFNITIEDTLITGRFDAVFKLDDAYLIMDFKTGDKRDYTSQLSFYKVCFKEKYDIKSEIKLSVYYLKEGISEIINPNDEKEEILKIKSVSDKIQEQNFIATPSKVCKDCAFKNICEFAV